jgi:predicted nucleic acid-binding protein
MSVEVVSEDLYFIDSNIWLYIFLPGQDGEKSRIAKELVRRHNANIVLSTQIVNEVVNGLIKHQVMDEPEIREFTRRL